MRTVNANFTAEKNKLQNRPIYLYILHDYNGSSDNLYFASYDVDVVFDGQTYSKFPITHEMIGENTGNEIDTVKVKVSNVSRLIQTYLESYDLRSKLITIRMVWADKLNDATCYLDDKFYIDYYTASAEAVEFVCTSKFDVLQLQLPARKYWRNYCTWKFKSTECGYAGAETACNKTFARCEALANKVRFGGFPSIPSHRIYIG